jgi:hypothetical protein
MACFSVSGLMKLRVVKRNVVGWLWMMKWKDWKVVATELTVNNINIENSNLYGDEDGETISI